MKIESQKIKIQASAERTYAICSNCNDFAAALPGQVSDWKSTENECSFTVPGIAQVRLNIVEKTEFSKIRFQAKADKPVEMELSVYINALEPNCETFIVIDADIPVMFSMMVKTPLQNFANQLIEKIKIKAEEA